MMLRDKVQEVLHSQNKTPTVVYAYSAVRLSILLSDNRS
jgi:hypothetical protein